ncbi:MAG: Gldg family protein [Pseudomonadota bacterium]
MNNATKKVWSVPGLLLLAALLVIAVLLSNTLFKGVRFDLTENQLYTMSDGTRNVLANIEEPISLYYYFSDTGTEQLPQIRGYARRVQETLEEYEQRARGKIKLQVIDPLPFSEEEDEAASAGVQAVPVSTAGDTVYFGLVGTNAVDDQSVIPFFDASKEAFLEYDLTKLVYSLANPKKTVVGLMSSLPVRGGLNPVTRQPMPPWTVISQFEQLFEIRDIDLAATAIDDQIDVLMIVHPKGLSDDTLYAIDQFMLRGGRALIFVDPHADSDQPPPDPNNPVAQFQSRASNLGPLFTAWGVEFTAEQFVADQLLALNVRAPDGVGQVRHLGLLGIDEELLDSDDVVTGGLNAINFGYAGSLRATDDAALTLSPLITTTRDSGLMGAQSLLFSQDPADIQDNFQPDETLHVLAARVAGESASAFAERAAAGNGVVSGQINAIVVADTDVLLDPFWVSVQQFFGQRLVNSFASNGDFVFNALDNLTGNADLISIRGRETYRRPFKRVEELKVQADERYRQTEEQLQVELATTEQRLGELQSARTDTGSMMMTPEQQAEIDSFIAQKAQIRKNLREVRRNLDRDIKRLGTTIKVLNAALVPLLLIIIVIVLAARKKRKIA